MAPARVVIFGRQSGPMALSAISIWEVSQKVRKGKLTLFAALDDWFAITLRPSFVTVLPIDADIARLSNNLPGFANEDPADRFIVATARKHHLTVITSDEKILSYGDVRTLW